MPLPLSVYFITRNEELRLPESIAKVQGWVDEIIVVDSGSVDRTCEIAREAGARVVHRDWQGFACQKAYAASLCRNDWVLDLDADEVLSDTLVRNIQALFASPMPQDVAGYRMRWVLSPPIQGHPFRHDKSKKILRLYNRKRAMIVAERDSNNDRPQVQEGRVLELKGDVLHRTLVSLEQMERKYCQLSSEQARYMHGKGRRISSIRLFAEFPVKFLKYYLLHRQVLNGWFGLSVAITAANRNFMRLAKARELQLMDELNRRQ
ncbi:MULTISPECIES: glycosyltransferase family 2 protein [Marinobacter]|uniref:Glycosyltransferase family 2 protein n=1 Tax=Marinobacter suaedae TaxID=3057675 RepID=A0ABT8W4Q4_9GAMM|nr:MULTISPECIES: glycosyltransferase family 2 protein [unclassified Marinobacter]MBZ2170170.1 glycosyltransferase family 2 protein [Marinobacter sp. F4216]MDO3723214.1 glycosyltransferase family 2 protein [Marinobacter sp. chi1]